MAEMVAILTGAAAFVAFVNGGMKWVSVGRKYLANRRKPAKRPDSTSHVRKMPKGGSGDNRPARPHQQLLQAPNITNGGRSPIRSFSELAGLLQQLTVRKAPPPRLPHNDSVDSFGGALLLTSEQQARDTHKDTSNYGVSTGARPRGSSQSSENRAMASAKAHWKSMKSSDCGVNTANARAVAVVDFTHSNVTIFVEKHKTYYRSYKVKSCPDIAGFVFKHRGHEAFSGEIVDGKLVRGNHSFTPVEADGECAFRSSNGWRKLGISAAGIEREVEQHPIFVEMVRGAVLGLLCCVHKNPSSLNVDMRYGNGRDFVHVDTNVRGKLEKGPDCCFSVFGICTNGWLREKVLVG